MSAKHRFRFILLVILLLMSGLAALDAQAQTAPVCPLTQGYWANHPESWTVTSLTLGAESYSQAELLALVPGGGGDASTILAVQLIAAKLNVAAGADATPINAVLPTADSLLAQFSGKLPYNIAPSSPEGQAMVNIAGLLDSFNNGELSPNCATTPTATFTPSATPTSTPTADPTSSCPDGLLLGGFRVAYGGRVYDPATDRTTFTYVVCGTGTPPDLSHFDVEIPVCTPQLEAVAYSPTDAVSFGTDPTTGINGIKWDLPLLTSASRTYTLTFAGNITEGSVQVAVKGGNGFTAGSLPGASCVIPSIDVEKFVSTDGATWQDADALPGPDVRLDQQVSFRFVVTNDGNAPLTDITLTETDFDLSGCTVPATLEPGAFFDCTAGPVPAVQGQHTNTATATGVYQGETITDSDGANYFGGDRPAIDVEKFVSSDGSTWADVDTAPGPQLIVGSNVSFRFVVTNTGNVPLANVGLTDNMLDLSGCTLLTSLEVGANTECVVGPVPVVQGQHTNTATVTADFNGTPLSDSDSANYLGGQTNLPVTIIIEGPVETVNVNIITIYDIDIEVNVNDPILNVIQIGDIVRVEGDTISGGDTIIVIAVTVVIVDVDVVVNVDGEVWRDSGDCRNGPPPWAPAHGWRRRCGGGGGGGSDDDDDD